MISPVQESTPTPALAVVERPPLTLPELDRAVHQADPAALLVLPRILRRVIKEDRQLTGWGLRVPHRKSYLISRDRLLEIVEPEELGLDVEAALPEKVILLAEPDADKLAAMTARDALIRCWRLLFHARIHEALEQAAAEGRFSAATVRQRIYQLGPVEFDEVRAVLQQESFLLPPRDDVQVYIEFAAVFLELHYFAPSLLPRYFPAFDDHAAVQRILAGDVDAAALFRVTRLAGAPDPIDEGAVNQGDDWPEDEESQDRMPLPTPPHPNEDRFRRLMRRAEKAAAVGNIVRSLIFRARAVPCATSETALRARGAVRTAVDRLLRRLQGALEIPQEDLKAWREPLLALAYQAPHGIWTAEARLLYDLQKVCVDFERGIYTVDLVEWALSWGERPIKRPLPSQRDVLMSKHLRSAIGRLPAVRLSDHARRQLSQRLRSATEQAEHRTRHHFRPRLVEALEQVGLKPRSVPERVARNKLVEELLDRIVEVGFLTMGDLRDGLSRNNLKLPDFARPADFLRGDQLLRADRQLSRSLDGVYRRGEFYLRWMQQLSSLAFGTRVGRILTRYAAVPFGGSFLAVAGLQHLVELATHQEPKIDKTPMVLALGLLLVAIVNFAWFRRAVWQAMKTAYRAARERVVDPVIAVLRSELVQRVLHSRAFVLTVRFLLKPLVVTVGVYLLLPRDRMGNPQTSVGIATAVFLAINLAINSRVGRTAEEILTDWVVQGWHRFGLRIITGLFWLVMDVFKGVLEYTERVLYTVDEWLRFRTGETRLSFAAKAVLGVIWFFVTYVVRFCINLLIEPQVNPIKHFPVVTVSHKLLLPFIPHLAAVLSLTIEKGLAWTIAGAVITSIPGIFGFLVWELKENWRLYEANRPGRLVPVPIGHHGESMVRLLKPGFHSGTLPKRYAKLRRAERKARMSGNWRGVRKHLHVLQHIDVAVRRFVERELIALLAENPAWQNLHVEVASVQLGSNRVRVALACARYGGRPLELAFELESGWMLAGVVEPGWLGQLPPQQRESLANAVAGLYKLGGTDLVRHQIEALLPFPSLVYKVAERGLIVSPEPTCAEEAAYRLTDEEYLVPENISGPQVCPMPILSRSALVFGDVAISWSAWIEAWDDRPEWKHSPRPLVAMQILPPPG